jgi:hypothetical protein
MAATETTAKRNAKAVSIAVAVIILAVVVFCLYKFVWEPMQTSKAAAAAANNLDADGNPKKVMPTRTELIAAGYTGAEADTIIASASYQNGTLQSW